MASVETIFLINFILNIAIAVSGIIVAMLIPSTKRIMAGEAGTSMGAPWIPVVIVIMVIVSIIVFPLSFLALDGNNLIFALVLDVIAISVTGLSLREFFTARKAYREFTQDVEEVHVVATQPSHEVYTQPIEVQQSHPYHGHTPTITVECPQCGNHLHIPEGSHQITCPHCGLSGTI